MVFISNMLVLGIVGLISMVLKGQLLRPTYLQKQKRILRKIIWNLKPFFNLFVLNHSFFIFKLCIYFKNNLFFLKTEIFLSLSF